MFCRFCGESTSCKIVKDTEKCKFHPLKKKHVLMPKITESDISMRKEALKISHVIIYVEFLCNLPKRKHLCFIS